MVLLDLFAGEYIINKEYDGMLKREQFFGRLSSHAPYIELPCIGHEFTSFFNYAKLDPDCIEYYGYRMVFASICEHASSAFIFASTSSDQFSHAAAST